VKILGSVTRAILAGVDSQNSFYGCNSLLLYRITVNKNSQSPRSPAALGWGGLKRP